MKTRLLSYGKNILQKLQRRANAKYAFKNFDLNADIYTVASRVKDSNGSTVGAKLLRKYPNACPKFEQPFCYVGDCKSIF